MAKKKASRKKASKKATKKKVSSSTTRETEQEERDTYVFCTHRMNEYTDPMGGWRDFKSGKIKQFRFHQGNMPAQARQTEIELFSARLDKYLLGLGYAGTEGARYHIRNSVGKATDPMQGLLDVVAENYKS